jgi:hypothetical protein
MTPLPHRAEGAITLGQRTVTFCMMFLKQGRRVEVIQNVPLYLGPASLKSLGDIMACDSWCGLLIWSHAMKRNRPL